jgi:hypothetical protein
MPCHATCCLPRAIHKIDANHSIFFLQDRRGNRVLIGINCLNFVLYLFAKGYYIWRNKRRDAIWDKMTSDVSLPTTVTTGLELWEGD